MKAIHVVMMALLLTAAWSPAWSQADVTGHNGPDRNGTAPEICFNPIGQFATGGTASSVFAADLDGDGDQDLAVANLEGNVSVLKNNADGTYAAAVTYATSDGANSICAADLDGDGDQDLAAANRDNNDISVLKNNGDGTYAAAANYPAGINPYSICAADLDGDGDQDLAVANYASDNVTVLKNDGDGTYAAAVNYATGNSPDAVVAADLDEDGDQDLVVANGGAGPVSVLKNNGDGTYAATVNYAAGFLPISVFAADLDGDGDRDLAVANDGSDNVSILKNNGNGTYAAAVNYGAGAIPTSVFAADLDGDGDHDLVVANYSSNDVSVLKNNGDGTYAPAINYVVRTSPRSVLAADLDGDGDKDLAVASEFDQDVSVLLNCTAPCNCPGQADPNGNGIKFEIGDAVLTINRAFFGVDVVTTPTCVCEDGDADCNGVIDVLDVLRFMAVVTGDADPWSFCAPNRDCSLPPCSPALAEATGGDVLVESKTVPAGATGVQIGVYVMNNGSLSALTLPLEIRSVTPGTFITTTPAFLAQGRAAKVNWNNIGLQAYYAAPSPGNLCSGPMSHSFDTAEFATPFVPSSPLGFFWCGLAVDRANCLAPGFDGFPGNGVPMVSLTFDVTTTPGTFEIDTCCIAPHNHLLFVDCNADTVLVPRFTKGVITIGTALPCACACVADPRCDGVRDIVDVLDVINAAFRGGNPTTDSGCPSTREDVDCNGNVDIIDVMRMIDVAIRGAEPASKFCNPCP